VTNLTRLRRHIAQWGGLNAQDALELIDIAEQSGARVEYGFGEYHGADPATTPPWEVQFVDADTAIEGPGEPGSEPVWTRVVGPWRTEP
jgi:hypothetical protein